MTKVDKFDIIKKEYYLAYCRKSSEAEDRQMQSIGDQLKIVKDLALQRHITVLKVFSESRSAKEPGRPEFNNLIDKIYSNKSIKGIICWSLNRLTRNPVDTGTLQWLLQNDDIEEIVTPTKTYTEIDSDFIMAIEGAQANRFIRDLRKDTQRGINSKLERGLAPILAPVGYKNNKFKDQGRKDISPHHVYFPLMRQIFNLCLTGSYSVERLWKESQKLGIRTNRKKELISHSQLYEALINPFYTGKFIYAGQIYQGKHKPMITDGEFERVKDIINGRSKPRQIKHNLLTGLITCGECGGMITGEKHTKHYKNGNTQTFTYYRCTKKNRKIKCHQPYISEKELEKQITKWLGNIKVSPRFIEWSIKHLNKMNDHEVEIRQIRQKEAERALKGIMTKLDNLVQLKISPQNQDNELLTDQEFLEQKLYLTKEKDKAKRQVSEISQRQDKWIDRVIDCFNFASQAQENFAKGTIDQKKQILRTIGSNLVLKDECLEIEGRGAFKTIEKAVTAKLIRLEPEDRIDNTGYYANLRLPNSFWGD